MKQTYPIKDKEKIKELLEVYPYGSKQHLLIAYALYTGLRVSDLLQANVKDSKLGVWQGREQKTNKLKTVHINKTLKKILDDYIELNKLQDDDYIFYSNKSKKEPIKRSRADKIIRHGGDMIGLVLSAHSLRKTFGYLAYQNGTDISLLMQIFNHSNQGVTLRYIGITQDNINQVYESINISI